MRRIEFEHPGEPLSKSNHYQICVPKGGKKPFMYVPADIKKYGAELCETAKKAMGNDEPISGPVQLNVQAYFGSRRRKDIQNTLKSLCDALNDVVYNDDSQIVSVVAQKLYDKDNPRLAIRVSELPIRTDYPLTSCKDCRP